MGKRNSKAQNTKREDGRQALLHRERDAGSLGTELSKEWNLQPQKHVTRTINFVENRWHSNSSLGGAFLEISDSDNTPATNGTVVKVAQDEFGVGREGTFEPSSEAILSNFPVACEILCVVAVLSHSCLPLASLGGKPQNTVIYMFWGRHRSTNAKSARMHCPFRGPAIRSLSKYHVIMTRQFNLLSITNVSQQGVATTRLRVVEDETHAFTRQTHLSGLAKGRDSSTAPNITTWHISIPALEHQHRTWPTTRRHRQDCGETARSIALAEEMSSDAGRFWRRKAIGHCTLTN